jgi:hypothetical protein
MGGASYCLCFACQLFFRVNVSRREKFSLLWVRCLFIKVRSEPLLARFREAHLTASLFPVKLFFRFSSFFQRTFRWGSPHRRGTPSTETKQRRQRFFYENFSPLKITWLFPYTRQRLLRRWNKRSQTSLRGAPFFSCLGPSVDGSTPPP